jgi:hypothetical protein
MTGATNTNSPKGCQHYMISSNELDIVENEIIILKRTKRPSTIIGALISK